MGVYSDDPRKLGSYWAEVQQIFTQCSQIIATVNMPIGMRYSNPFWKSVATKVDFAAFPLKLIAMTTSLG